MNRELQGSEEEIPPLSEEPAAVNAQLGARLGELEVAANDLESLLTGTDVAVLFLDPSFRIRRFTPAVGDLLDLVPSDVGRPFADLRPKLRDPDLLADARQVLDRLAPIEREVSGEGGRHYLRRIHPSRTQDGRVAGALVAFVDVTDRRRSADAAMANERRHSFLLGLSDALRDLGDAGAIQRAACRLLVDRLGFNRAECFEVRGEEFVVANDWTAGAPSRAGLPSIASFGPETPSALRSGRTSAADDPDPTPEVKAALAGASVAALVAVPLMQGGALVAGLAVSSGVPRRWSPAEVELVEAVAERTWSAVERARVEAALRENGAWLAGQKEAFQAAVEGAPLEVSLGILIRTAVEALGEGTRAAFYLTEDEGATLKHVVGMGDAYARVVDGFLIGPESVACGLAASIGEAILTADVMEEPRWEPWRWMAERFDYRGCWSFPVFHPSGRVVGTFTVYSRLPREATGRELRLASLTIDAASIIISRQEESEARRQAEAALKEGEVRYRTLFEAMDEGFAVVQVVRGADGRPQDLRVLELNPAFERRAGMSRGLLRTPGMDGPSRVNLDVWIGAFARAAESGEPVAIEGYMEDLGRWYEAGAYPRSGDRLSVFLRDVTERKRAEAAMRESESRLRRALAAARMGIWTLDPGAGAQMRDASLNRLLGLEPEDSTQPFEEFLTHVHPEDVEAVRAAFSRSMHEGRPLNLEFRVVRPDGSIRWLRDQGDVFGDEAAGSKRMTGACVDVTDRREAEDALKASEERVRLILESATDFAILTMTSDRIITSWSPGAEAAFGYSADEMIGRPADVIFTPEDREAGAPEAEAEIARREGRSADERWHLRKDGTTIYAMGVVSVLRDAEGSGFVKVARDLTERKRMEDELREAHDLLEVKVEQRTAELVATLGSLEAEMGRRRRLALRLFTAQEDERQRLSRELHDGLGQQLTALTLGLKALERSTPEDAPSRHLLRDVERIVVQMGRESHDLAVELRPTALDDIGLDAALSDYVARWSDRTGVRVEFQPLGLERGRLSPDVETAAYRIVQEALNNIAKHAGAGRVGVMMTRFEQHLIVLIEDDGRGFDPERVAAGRERLGLLGMRERTMLLGGEFTIESVEGEGTVVRARIPLQGNSEENGHGT